MGGSCEFRVSRFALSGMPAKNQKPETPNMPPVSLGTMLQRTVMNNAGYGLNPSGYSVKIRRCVSSWDSVSLHWPDMPV